MKAKCHKCKSCIQLFDNRKSAGKLVSCAKYLEKGKIAQPVYCSLFEKREK